MKTRSLRLDAIGLALAVGTVTGALAADETHGSSKAGSAPPTATRPTPSVTAQNSTSPSPNPLPSLQVAGAKAQARPALPVWSSQVLKLVQAGVADDVIFSYIDSAGTFNLTADQIISLSRSGVQRDVIAAMIQHDADIIAGVKQVLPSTVPSTGAEPLFIPPPPPGAEATTVAQIRQPVRSEKESPPLDSYTTDFLLEPLDEFYQPPESHEVSPVRKPYPVKLTDPILVWRVPCRFANTTVVETFP